MSQPESRPRRCSPEGSRGTDPADSGLRATLRTARGTGPVETPQAGLLLGPPVRMGVEEPPRKANLGHVQGGQLSASSYRGNDLPRKLLVTNPQSCGHLANTGVFSVALDRETGRPTKRTGRSQPGSGSWVSSHESAPGHIRFDYGNGMGATPGIAGRGAVSRLFDNVPFCTR